jgi:APA family basic amino acid/polyamine antiporter
MEKENETQSIGLKRDMTLFGGISIIGGIVIGSGIFYLGSYVLERTQMSMGLALLCWLIGGIVSILGGICFAELGACDPKAGGMVVYLDKAYHPVVGYMFGFTSWLLSGAGSIAALAIALPTTFQGSFELSEATVKIIAIALIIGFTTINFFGIKTGSIFQNVSLVAKLIPIGIIIIAALATGNQHPDLSLVPQGGFEGGFGNVIGMIAFATVATLWAYEGWTNVNSVAGEIQNPGKNLPIALISGIGACTILYILFNFSIFKVLPIGDITAMIEDGNLYLGTEVAKRVLGNVGGILVQAAMLIAMISCLNGMIISFARYYYAMAVEGHFFKSQAKLSEKHHVPANALFWQAVISIILVLLRDLDQLISLVVFCGMMFNMLVVAAVFIYRKKFPDLERPYKVWGYPVTVIISVILFTALMLNTLIEDPITSLIGLIVPAVGALVYYIFDIKLKKEKQAKSNS